MPMANNITLTSAKRSEKPGVTRSKQMVPAVLYGHGIENISIAIDSRKLDKVFEEAGYTTLINLEVDGKSHPVLIKDAQLHPLKGYLTHIDFHQVRLDEKVTADVPLTFEGESPAVKDKGGVLIRNFDSLEVEALPQNLPHEIKIDISKFTEFDKPFQVKDIVLPEGVELLHELEDVIALVQAPRTEEELEELSTEATEDVSAVEGVKEEVPAEEGETVAEESKE